MTPTHRSILILLFTIFFSANPSIAQPQLGESINASIGFGVSAPYDDVEIYGSGFFVEAEYAIGLKSWFGLRPYAGFISTSPDSETTAENLLDFEVTSKAFFLGGKARIVAPIPWFAPFIELGVGASVGQFRTFTPFTNIEKKGILVHIPLGLGVALGPKHNFELAVNYYFHPSVEQFNGAVAIGLSFPLKS